MNVLVLARTYPNSVTELHGLWVQSIVSRSTAFCRPTVISPVPYCPPLPGIPLSYSRFRKVERARTENGTEVFHPRLLVGPAYSTYSYESALYLASVRGLVNRLWRKRRFDLIHAHFTYPDGVVAMELSKQYHVPFVITEHIPWNVWDARYRHVQKRAGAAAAACFRHLSVSTSVQKTVEEIIGRQANLTVVPNGVDGSIFTTEGADTARARNRVLFAGAVRPVKGVDVLLRAMKILVERGSPATLEIAGEPFFSQYRKEDTRLREMVVTFGLHDRVRFLGKQLPRQLARLMRDSSVLVLPSHAESFGMVLTEALACGTPVVSTRCGGPEDIVTEEVGVLVRPNDPEQFADGIERVLDRQTKYDPGALRSYALANFGIESVGDRVSNIYRQAVAGSVTYRATEISFEERVKSFQ